MRFLVMGLLLYIGYRIVVSLLSAKKPPAKQDARVSPTTETHRDPVCGVYVSEEDAVIGKLEGERHYFCSMNCLEKFREQLDHTTPS
ncbi:MAG: YHS domain-containing protein [Geobacteraceae bacterium]|nr:YHS domain-containing protein [Geobacteraceae bacterium]NTW80224.1 YHS domain-containing protein [Geobacteraceae bacterium]